MNKFLKSLMSFKLAFSHVVNSRIMYHNLKEDKFARERTTLLGRRALRHTLCFALFVFISIITFYFSFKAFTNGQIFPFLLGVMFGIYTAIYSLVFLPLSLNLTIKQLILNKKAIGFLDLTLLIIVLIAFIALICFLKFN